jgi:hypothetical protein
MNRKAELAVGIFVIVSLLCGILYYSFTLSASQALAVYIFDLIVATLLAIDFYTRLKASGKDSRFIAKGWYEMPAMLPLVLCLRK